MKLLPIAFLCLLLFSCKKKDEPETKPEPKPEPEFSVQFTLSKPEATPGDILHLKPNKKLSDRTIDILFNSSIIEAYSSGDSSYFFMVPVVPAGKVAVSVPGIANSKGTELTISNYTPIANPQNVIDDFAYTRDAIIHNLSNPNQGDYQVPATSMSFIKELKAEWDMQLKKLSSEQKLLLAYFIEKNKIPNSLLRTSAPSEANTYRVAGNADDSDLMFKNGVFFATYKAAQTASKFSLIGATALLLYSPTPITLTAFIIAATAYKLTKIKAEEKFALVVNLQPIIDKIDKAQALRVNATEFINNEEKKIQLTMKARSLIASDTGLNPQLDEIFRNLEELKKIDLEVEGLYNSAKKYLPNILSPYTPFSGVIGKSPPTYKDLEINGKDIIIKGVSDNRVSYTTSITGNSLKIKISSASAVDIPFKITISYKRSLDQKEFVQEIDCIFKAPAPFSMNIVSGNNQDADAGKALTDPLIVLVKDSKGLAMSGVTVLWNVTSGGGKLTSASSITNASGQASTNWTLGASGTQTVTATVKKADGSNIVNSPLTFNATIGVPFISYKLDGILYKSVSVFSTFNSNLNYWTLIGNNSQYSINIQLPEIPQKGKVYNLLPGPNNDSNRKIPWLFITAVNTTNPSIINISSGEMWSEAVGSVTITSTEPYIEGYFNLSVLGYFKNQDGSIQVSSSKSIISEGLFRLRK